ncbi:cell division topological specificity factor MinE [Aquirhabdus parva]|jgi:cell division topological specificity factor|uniref:Cell division topological specificity factor n=1 Tax=Aquirhabdus parva TaxID=2283318 RepID=A0A345P4G3_9GAMM|nr:cell division topological specificity factor MinE [Aquirhabdus parva]AXI02172.1 cell division topological specificity factor MinE [Aquirhabdus parva]
MSFWANLFKSEPAPTSAKTAADRLKVIIATENRLGRRLSQDTINRMKSEIMEVVNRYVRGVTAHDIHMSVRTEDNIEMLEMNINLPEDQPT